MKNNDLPPEWVAIKDNTSTIMPTISPFGLDGNLIIFSFILPL